MVGNSKPRKDTQIRTNYSRLCGNTISKIGEIMYLIRETWAGGEVGGRGARMMILAKLREANNDRRL